MPLCWSFHDCAVSLQVLVACAGSPSACGMKGALGVRAGLSKLAGVDASEEEINKMIAKEVPLGVVGAKWDIGIATVFLCSPAARYITGHTRLLSAPCRCALGYCGLSCIRSQLCPGGRLHVLPVLLCYARVALQCLLAVPRMRDPALWSA